MHHQPTHVSGSVRSARRWLWLLPTLALLPLVNCINPQVVNKTSEGRLYPLAPGEQPFVLVTLINNTTATIDTTVLVDMGLSQPLIYTFENFSPGTRTQGVLIPYPFLRLALGNLDNPIVPSISATLPDGLTVQVPFGHNALIAGTDFQSGDTLIFEFVADSRSPVAIQVHLGKVDAETQTGPFTRADTFLVVTGLLALNGLNTTTGQ